MSFSITASLSTQRRLDEAGRGVSQTFQRLSSGLRINRASDDAAGLAIAENLNLDSRVYAQSTRNISDGISALSIADGALVELSQIVIRQRELAEQAANGVYSSAQRQALQSEATALTHEYNRITQAVSFNNINLFDTSVSLSIQFGYGANNNISANMSSEFDSALFAGGFNSYTSFASAGVDAAYADVNGDGLSDIVSVNNSNYFQTLLSNGDGTYKSAISSSLAFFSSDRVATGDLNGDGKLDVVTNTGNFISVNMGNGNGTFLAAASYATGVTSGGDGLALTIVDINGDSYLDILTSDTKEAGSFTAFLNTGSGGFSAGVLTSGLSSDASGFAAADYNGDGRTDFISDNGGLYLANANGSFSVSSAAVVGGATGDQMIAGDFNQDGKYDVAYSSGTGIKVSLGNGNGTFSAGTTIMSGISSLSPLQFVDLNNDGNKDLFAYRTATSNNAYIAYGNGNGTFGATLTFSYGAATASNDLALADVTGDGVLDMINHNNGGVTYEVSVAQTTQTTTMRHFSVLTAAESRESLTYLSGLANKISSQRGAIGATLSRLESAHQSVTTQKLNTDEARSQIMDADVAQETASLVRYQILQNSAAALLAQIGKASQIDLTLLQEGRN